MKLLNLDPRFWRLWFRQLEKVPMTPEIRAKVDAMRQRIAARDPTLTPEDMAPIIALYREARGAISANIEAKKKAVKEPKTKKVKAAPKSADDLFNVDLGGSNEQV